MDFHGLLQMPWRGEDQEMITFSASCLVNSVSLQSQLTAMGLPPSLKLSVPNLRPHNTLLQLLTTVESYK